MTCYDPSTSILAGMDDTVLRANLAKLQQGYLDLVSGGKGKSFSYTQGDGAKAVVYTEANLGDLIRAIRVIQAQLGIIQQPQRSAGVRF